MAPDGYKGKIIVYGDTATMARAMREAIEEAATMGVEIVYAQGTAPPDSRVIDVRPLAIKYIEPIRIPVAIRREDHVKRSHPDQPWYAKFQKNKRR